MQNIPDNNKKSKPVTLPLFDFDQIPAVEAVKKRKYWYYITRRLNSEMMVSFDMDGGHLWCEHDTRVVTPHLFNSDREARRIVGTNPWSVHKWQYSRV